MNCCRTFSLCVHTLQQCDARHVHRRFAAIAEVYNLLAADCYTFAGRDLESASDTEIREVVFDFASRNSKDAKMAMKTYCGQRCLQETQLRFWLQHSHISQLLLHPTDVHGPLWSDGVPTV